MIENLIDLEPLPMFGIWMIMLYILLFVKPNIRTWIKNKRPAKKILEQDLRREIHQKLQNEADEEWNQNAILDGIDMFECFKKAYETRGIYVDCGFGKRYGMRKVWVGTESKFKNDMFSYTKIRNKKYDELREEYLNKIK